MNPYSPWLYGVPAAIAILAAIPRRRAIRYGALALATLIYWIVLQQYVTWAFDHPFNPADGGPKVFAALFGWAAGLLTLILPVYWIAMLVRTFIRFLNGTWPSS